MIGGFVERFGRWTDSTRTCVILYSALYSIVIAFALFPLLVYGKSLLWTVDGTTQAYAYFAYFGHWVRDALYQVFVAHGDVSTWAPSRGYGDDLYASFLPNFINPFSLVAILVPSAFAEPVYHATIVAKLYCAGLLFFAYARLRDMPRRSALLGSLCYAFAGTSVVMFAQPGFLSSLIVFPMLLCGAELVMARRNPLVFVYAVCLACSSVQSALVFALFLGVYLAYRILFSPSAPPRRDRLGTFLRLAGYGVLALGLSSLLLVPMILNNMVGMERLAVERTVPAVYPLGTYISYYLGLVSHCALNADGFWGFGPLFLSALVVLCMRRRRHRALVLLAAAILLLVTVPFLSSALNAFQYPNLRWFWMPAFAGAWVVAALLGEFDPLTPRQSGLLVGAALAYGALAALLPWGTASAAFWISYSLALVGVGLLVAASFGLLPPLRLSAALVALACAGGAVNLATYVDPGYDANLYGLEDAGEAYAVMTEESASAALGPLNEEYHGSELSGDDLWRFDDAVSHAYNSNTFNERLGIDFYSSLYSNEVDDFHRSIALNNSSAVNFLGLNSRSPLEALLGVRYFVAPRSADGVIVPYQFDELSYEYFSWDVLTTRSYLPLAFAVNRQVSRSSWDGLGFVERQAALLGAVVLEDDERAALLPDTSSTACSAQDAMESLGAPYDVPYECLGTVREDEAEGTRASRAGTEAAEGAVVKESAVSDTETKDLRLSPLAPGGESGYVQRLSNGSGFTVRAGGSEVYLSFDAPAGSEVYVVFENLRYTPLSARDTYSEDEWDSASELTKRSVEWTSAVSGGTRVAKVWAKGFEQTAWSDTSVYTADYHMYAGHHDFALNLGVSDEELSGAVLQFRDAGVYTYDSMTVWVQPMEGLEAAVEELQGGAASNLRYANGVISGTVDMDSDGLLFLSVSYSDGWSATVDGQPADVLRADVAFMAVPMGEGSHSFELRYRTPHALEGAAVSVVSAVVLVALLVRRRAARR